MAFFFQLIILGVFGLLGFQVWKQMSGRARVERSEGKTLEGTARDVSSPARRAASTLKDFEEARARLRERYPLTFDMLGGYLNARAINERGSVEAAAREMIEDWTPRADELSRELTRLLAENDTEEECRAVIVAACDADFNREGHRSWLTWLLGQFNDLG